MNIFDYWLFNKIMYDDDVIFDANAPNDDVEYEKYEDENGNIFIREKE